MCEQVSDLGAKVLPLAYRYICVPSRVHNRTAHTLFTTVVTHVLTLDRLSSDESGAQQMAAAESAQAKTHRRLSWLGLGALWSKRKPKSAEKTEAQIAEQARSREETKRCAESIRLVLPYYLRLSLQVCVSLCNFLSICVVCC